MENRTNKSTQISESVFSRFSAWVVTKLRDGIFGRFFTSYDSTDKKFKAGIKNLKKNNTQKRTKRTIARAIETNPIVNSVPKIHQFLSRVAIRDYGVVLMTMAIISTTLFFVQNYVPALRWSLSSLVTGIVIAVFSIPMLFSKRTIASLLFEGRLCNSFLFGYLGMSDEVYRYASDDTSHSSPSIALLVGMVLSVVAYFPGLLLALAIILIVFLAYNVLITPEVGVILIILSMPFTNVSVMTGIGLYVAICYIIKCVTGRRTFKLEFMDLWMLIISLVIIYGGFVTFDFGSSIMHMLSMLALLSTFFVASNLVRSKEWFKRCIISFCISSTIASALGILQFVFGKLNIVWDGMKEFSTIHERAVSSFDSSTSFALYLVSAIPFLLLFIFSGKTSKARAIGLTCSLINIVALVLTYSKVGYIGAIAMLIFLLIIFHRNTAYLVLFGATVAIVLNYALPK
ncbi:MAG: hypothetical protein J6A54_05200, partial [Clostridia bacterium]|nr:hypothetical protein [Clostridia bacterium]